METHTQRFPWFLFVVVLFAVAIALFRFNDYVLQGNFTLLVNSACDVNAESCFEAECSPEEEIGCPEGPYKKIQIKKADAPPCLEEHTCMNFQCPPGAVCEVTYCSDETVEDGEHCYVPPEPEVFVEDTNATSSATVDEGAATSTTLQDE